MGGASASSPATAGERQRIRRWSKALKPAAPGARPEPDILATGCRRRVDRSGRRRRQEGNGRSDAVRLSTRRTLRRVQDRVTGKWRWFPGSSLRRRSSDPRSRKRDEPQGRKRGATNPQACCGESRRGGEKPRGRNESRGWNPRTDGQVTASAERGSGVDAAGDTAKGRDERAKATRGRNGRDSSRLRHGSQRSRERSEDDAKTTRVDRPAPRCG